MQVTSQKGTCCWVYVIPLRKFTILVVMLMLCMAFVLLLLLHVFTELLKVRCS